MRRIQGEEPGPQTFCGSPGAARAQAGIADWWQRVVARPCSGFLRLAALPGPSASAPDALRPPTPETVPQPPGGDHPAGAPAVRGAWRSGRVALGAAFLVLAGLMVLPATGRDVAGPRQQSGIALTGTTPHGLSRVMVTVPLPARPPPMSAPMAAPMAAPLAAPEAMARAMSPPEEPWPDAFAREAPAPESPTPESPAALALSPEEGDATGLPVLARTRPPAHLRVDRTVRKRTLDAAADDPGLALMRGPAGPALDTMDPAVEEGPRWLGGGVGRRLPHHDTATLEDLYTREGYRLEAVRLGAGTVPRLLSTAIPDDIGDLHSIQRRKDLFIALLLPLILAANEVVLEERRHLLMLRDVAEAGLEIGAEAEAWLAAQRARYRLPEDAGWDALLLRADKVPPSLALAQAAVETGWGTSSLARNGRSLFGQRRFVPGGGKLPDDPEAVYDNVTFDELLDGVRAYVNNLNTHGAYRGLRERRAAMRRQGEEPDSISLAGYLLRYSELGPEYVERVRRVLRENALYLYDRARLDSTMPAVQQFAADTSR